MLVPLTESSDPEVQRLAAHALANLSVDGGCIWAIYYKDLYLVYVLSRTVNAENVFVYQLSDVIVGHRRIKN